jgi:TRAP-type uncharacterized transport system substrate-binding protein
MWPWRRQALLRTITATLCIAAVVWLALWYFIPAPPSTITIAAGLKGGAFEQTANRYREALARQHVTLELRFVDAPPDVIKSINDPKFGVDAAFIFAGQSNSAESPDLASLGRIYSSPYWIFYRGEELDSLAQVKGKRLNIPVFGKLPTKVLDAFGINAGNTTITDIAGPAAIKAFEDRQLDVVYLPPIELSSPSIQALLRDPAVRLMNVTQTEALTRLFPALRHLVLPQGVIDLGKNIPTHDMNLIASTIAIVVRKELHPQLVYLLAQTLQEEHGGAGIFQHAGEFPTLTDPEYPFAEGALDFYKNGPSLLQRYLPFWMISYAKRVAAILVTVIAIVIPLLTYAPKLYQWFLHGYLKKLFRRLRTIEAELRTELTAPQIEALQTNLETINRAANILPSRHSDAFFDLIIHIRLTRAELTSRLDALRRQAA